MSNGYNIFLCPLVEKGRQEFSWFRRISFLILYSVRICVFYQNKQPNRGRSQNQEYYTRN